jgi:protein involved in polysaccharide export with SLBB domain
MDFVAWNVERRNLHILVRQEFCAAMKRLLVLLLLFALAGDDPEAAKAQRERLYKLHLGDALEFTIYRDADRNEPLEFRKQPIYVWTNPVRAAQQD